MSIPGNLICYGMLGALAMIELLRAEPWIVVVASFAIGWYFNEKERERDA